MSYHAQPVLAWVIQQTERPDGKDHRGEGRSRRADPSDSVAGRCLFLPNTPVFLSKGFPCEGPPSCSTPEAARRTTIAGTLGRVTLDTAGTGV